MSDEELRKHIAQKGCKVQIIMAILTFFGGYFIGNAGIPAMGLTLWGLTVYLIVDAVRVTKNAKKAEQEYFNRRKQ